MSAASAAVGPASGCETMGSGLRPGCMWRNSCPFDGSTFAACHSIQSHQQVKRLLFKLIIGVNG